MELGGELDLLELQMVVWSHFDQRCFAAHDMNYNVNNTD